MNNVTTRAMATEAQADAAGSPLDKLAGRRILLVADHPPLTESFASVLRSAGSRVHLARSWARGMQAAESLHHDGAIIDAFLPDGNGLKIVEQLRAAARPCAAVVVTGVPNQEVLDRAVKLGVSDVLFEPFDRDLLVPALIRAVETSEKWSEHSAELSRGRWPRVAPEPAPEPGPAFDVDVVTQRLARRALLTRREGHTLGLMLRGLRIEEMAQSLGISVNTIKFHVRNILRKLGLRNRSELLRLLVD